MLSIFKKVAIATLIAAPLVADFAMRSVPAPVAPTETLVPVAAPAPAPKIVIAPIKPMIANPLTSAGTANMNGIDPAPTLDPNALAAGIPAAAPQALPKLQAQPPMPQVQAQGRQLAAVNGPDAAPQGSGDFKPAPSERINKF